jgi:predicted RNase H-like HicB family nuclease
MEYTILVYKAEEGGFWAEVPALPGCYSQGETIEETMENVKEAIEAHLLALKEEREEVPTEKEFVIGRVKVGVSAVV